MDAATDTPGAGNHEARRIVRVYLAITALFTLAASLIWGVNTLFLLGAGLSLFQVMVVNAAFSAGQLVFEVPTGVVADTIGRRASYLLGIFALSAGTLAYVASERFGWGMAGFVTASVMLGFGFTCQTGAVDAWLVDALDHVRDAVPRETVFARGGMVTGVAMLVGTLAGGFLGQVDLAVPYYVRSAVLVAAFLLAAVMMRDIGFVPRVLRASRFAEETRTIARAGIRYGWREPVVRPLLFASLLHGTFMLFFFYSTQPYALELLGRPDLVWVAGALAALYGIAGVGGNLCVGPLMRTRFGRDSARLLGVGAVVEALAIAGIAASGWLAPAGGSTRAFATFVVLFGLFGLFNGVTMPVRQAYINRWIPTEQRATVLSLDAFFADAGGGAGQPAFGWLATVGSIPGAYLVGAVLWGVAGPLYAVARRAEDRASRA